MSAERLPWNLVSARQRVVLEVVVREGDGTTYSPHRHVTYYLAPDGKRLAVDDKWADHQ